VLVRLDDGREIMAAPSALEPLPDGNYQLRLGGTDIDQLTSALRTAGDERAVIPLVAEELAVGKRTVETGRVRVVKSVREEQQTVDQPLMAEQVEVERVAVNRVVDGPVEVRHEGDVMVVPVLEEVLVVEKRLMLREELRITRRRTETRQPQTVTLRKEEATIERIPADGSRGGTNVAQ
jgi:uncharacterized protein (TIGR02271 family)